MTVDYDTPRRSQVEAADESLDQIAGRNVETSAAARDVDDADPPDSYDLPDIDITGEELLVRVVPKQPDEFTCGSCFLVHHRSRLAFGTNGRSICTECA